MVEIRQRKGPSGPFGDEDGGAVLYARNVSFGEYTAIIGSPNTSEQSRDIYLYPVPVTAPPVDWSVIANPQQHHVGEEILPVPPFWMTDWSHSHIRIAENSVDMNALDPVIPAGTLGVLIKLGMSFVKPLPALATTIDDLIFDVMLIQQVGVPRTPFVFAPPP